jgi:hypothetical protein
MLRFLYKKNMKPVIKQIETTDNKLNNDLEFTEDEPEPQKKKIIKKNDSKIKMNITKNKKKVEDDSD